MSTDPTNGMKWYVVRHPEVGAAVIPESALEHHRIRGWARVSDPIGGYDKDHVDVELYRVDLDSIKTEEPAKQAKKKEH